MPKNKGNNKKKKQAVQKLADAVKTPVTTKPDVPEPDEAFLAPVREPSPFDNALQAFDPTSSREFGRKMRDAGTAATSIADRVEEARQISRQIDGLTSEHLQAPQKEAAQQVAADLLKGLEAAAAKAATDRATMDQQFVAGWAKAKDIKAPSPRDMQGANDTVKRLRAAAKQRTDQEKELEGAGKSADAILDAWKPVDENAQKIQAALNKLKAIIQAALQKQAEAAARAQQQRELIEDAKGAVLRAEQTIASKLIGNATRAKVPVDPQMAIFATAATEALKKQEWRAALDAAQSCLGLAKLLGRAVAKAGAAEDTYKDESARVSALLVTLRSDLTRLKLKSEGPFAELKKFEDAAKAAALKKSWAEAMEAVAELEDRIEQGQKVIPKFDRYLKNTPPMLLQATFNKVVVLPSLKTNDQMLAKLQEIYEKQCTVKADDWRRHLGYQPPFKGTPMNHYSTFPDSIVADEVTVFKKTAGVICEELFEAQGWLGRIHATFQFNGVNHHKYYGGFYSGGLQIGIEDGLDEQQPQIRQGLDATYGTMVNAMHAGVGDAMAKHGRVGSAVGGPAVS